jgi:hypothetical protein
MDESSEDAGSTVASTKEPPRHAAMSTIAENTEAGYKSAISAFDRFCSQQEYPPLRKLLKEDIEGKAPKLPGFQQMLQEFCTFLISEYSKNNKHYMPGTAAQYLSGIKTVVEKKFKGLEMFQPGKSDWYDELYDSLKMRARVAAIARGEPVENRTVGIHRDLIIKICDQLLEEGTVAAMEERAILTTLYHAVGRGGEVSTSNWDTAIWQVVQGEGRFCLNWGELKGGKSSIMPFFPDFNECPACFVHAMASYQVCKAGRSSDGQVSWMFPAYVDMKGGGATTKASSILKRLRGLVEGLLSEHTAHSLRAGASDDMLFHPLASIAGAIARGNWDFSGDCLLFRYMNGMIFVALAGKILAGYPNPEQDVAFPSLGIVCRPEAPGVAQSLEALAHSLFKVEVLHSERLRPFRNAMLASLLMYHQVIAAKYGIYHILVRKMVCEALTLGISHSTLCSWGKAIGDDFHQRNRSNSTSRQPLEARATIELETLRSDVQHLLADNKQQSGKIEQMSEKIDFLTDKIDQFTTLLQQHLLNPTVAHSPSSESKKRKKRRDSSPPKESTAVEPPVKQVPVNPFPVMKVAAARAPAPGHYASTKALLDTGLATFIEDVAKYNIGFSPSCYGPALAGKDPKSARSKAHNAHIMAMTYATKEQKHILGVKKPAALSEYSEWLANIRSCSLAIERTTLLALRDLRIANGRDASDLNCIGIGAMMSQFDRFKRK